MKTIEERAEIYEKEYPHIDDSHYSYYVRDGYIQGAIDQKKLDDEEYRKDMTYIVAKKQEWVNQACEWLFSELGDTKLAYPRTELDGEWAACFVEDFIDNFRKSMEE